MKPIIAELRMDPDCLHCAVMAAIAEFGSRNLLDAGEIMDSLVACIMEVVSRAPDGMAERTEEYVVNCLSKRGMEVMRVHGTTQ